MYPDEFIIDLAILLKYFGIRNRVVLAVDFGFSGLEKKFRVKAFQKELKQESNIKAEHIPTRGLFEKTEMICVEESLD